VGRCRGGAGPRRILSGRRAGHVPNGCIAGFLRGRDTLAGAWASADAVVHGSAAETYGLVVAEGLCSGLPLVVPDTGGAADLAAPEYAETYPPGDVDACVAALQRLLTRDFNTLQAAALDAAAQRVGTMRDHFEQLFEFYGKLACIRSAQSA